MQAKETREIDGQKFVIHQMPAMASLKFLAKLGRIAGPALAELAGANTQAGQDALLDMDSAKLGSILSMSFDKLTDKEVDSVVETLLKSSQVYRTNADTGQEAIVQLHPIINLEMRGKTLTFLKLLGFALEVNYGSFFDALKGAAATRQVAASVSTSAKS